MTTPTVGPLLPEHAGEALTVQRAAYVTEAQRYLAPGIPPLRETVDALRADLVAGVLARGAWLGTRLVGAVRGRVDGAAMEIARFVVAPDVQGLGIGRSLLTAIETAAPPSVTAFWLVTGARSDDNLRFYGRAGYVETGRTEDDAGVGLVRLSRQRVDASTTTGHP